MYRETPVMSVALRCSLVFLFVMLLFLAVSP